MVETRRSSSASKSFSASSSSPELSSHLHSLPSDLSSGTGFVPTPTIAGEVVTDGEKSKAGKNGAKDPWAKLLSEI
ncbi:hypothetical protein Bca52824_061356 [Brassica carinata]|uniref:Uncharacterized protein n=1 Tax=Brassica carinata TaxID=52824 RepID=A0A8X7QZ94_BRACI|nr:hypothetical protein Bca52824_061356 [Brassica carinata]